MGWFVGKKFVGEDLSDPLGMGSGKNGEHSRFSAV